MSIKLTALLVFVGTMFGQTFPSIQAPPARGLIGYWNCGASFAGVANATAETTWPDLSGNGSNLTGHFLVNLHTIYPGCWIGQNTYTSDSGQNVNSTTQCGGSACSLANAGITASEQATTICGAMQFGEGDNSGGQMSFITLNPGATPDPTIYMQTAPGTIRIFGQVVATYGPTVVANGSTSVDSFKHSGPMGFCMTMGASNVKVYYNQESSGAQARIQSSAAAANRSWTGLDIGVSHTFGPTTLNVSFYELRAMNVEWSSAEVTQYFRYLQDAYYVPRSIRNKIVMVGDSITAGRYNYGALDPGQYIAQQAVTPPVYAATEIDNIGEGNSRTTGWMTVAETGTGTYRDQYNGGASADYMLAQKQAGLTGKNIAVLMIGTNDCAAATAAATIYANIKTIGTDLLTTYDYVIISTISPRNDSFNTCVNSVNTLLKADTFPNAYGSTLVDINTAVPYNTTNYNQNDFLHWTNAGSLAGANAWWAAIQPQLR